MIPDGEHTAVLDRFEEDRAVLIVEVDGEDADQIDVHRTWLPTDARRVDAIFAVTIEDGRPVALDHDPDESRRRREAAQDRFDRLSSRPPDEDSDEES